MIVSTICFFFRNNDRVIIIIIVMREDKMFGSKDALQEKLSCIVYKLLIF